MIRFSIVSLLLTIALVAGQSPDDLVNSNVDRALDLVSHLPKETITVTVENKGSKGVRSYDYYVEPSHANDVVFVGAVVSISIRSDSFSLISFSRSKERIVMIKDLFK